MTRILRLHASCSRLARNTRGVSVVEFALIAPVIGFLIIGVIDLSNAFSQQLHLERAATQTLEKATARGMNGSDYDYLVSEAVAASGEPAGNVTLQYWLECDNTKQTLFTGACTAGQQIARYVSISIASTFHPMFQYGPLGAYFGSDGTSVMRIRGDAVVRVQ